MCKPSGIPIPAGWPGDAGVCHQGGEADSRAHLLVQTPRCLQRSVTVVRPPDTLLIRGARRPGSVRLSGLCVRRKLRHFHELQIQDSFDDPGGSGL